MKLKAIVGPFTDGHALKLVLKKIRRHYPYCTCFKPHLRHCLNSQINICPGYCCQKNYSPKATFAHNYQRNIKTVKKILEGKNPSLLKKIFQESDYWAAQNILEHKEFLEGNPLRQSLRQPADDQWKKIECYDISNFAGKEAVGAMTVLVKTETGWQPDKNQFRKFKIKKTYTRDDPRMIAEILERRLNHPEWPYPDLIVIDGGITQYHAALKASEANKLTKPKLIAFAKPQQQLVGLESLSAHDREIVKILDQQKVIERAIKQTHNFVINYHRQLRDKIAGIS